jgi:D123
LANYVFDVYVDRSDRVWLVDFNVWNVQTDALMYTWEELVDMPVPLLVGEESDDSWPELRIVETPLEVRQDPLSSYRAPMDTVTLASNNNNNLQQTEEGVATSFESFMAMCQKPSEWNTGDSSSDDED